MIRFVVFREAHRLASLSTPNAGEDADGLICHWWGCTFVQRLWKTVLVLGSKTGGWTKPRPYLPHVFCDLGKLVPVYTAGVK